MMKRDYILLCHAVARGAVQGSIMKSIADMLATDNPKFDRDKFNTYVRKLIIIYQDDEATAAVTNNTEAKE